MNHYLRSKITQRGNRNEETICIDSRDRKNMEGGGGGEKKKENLQEFYSKGYETHQLQFNNANIFCTHLTSASRNSLFQVRKQTMVLIPGTVRTI